MARKSLVLGARYLHGHFINIVYDYYNKNK